jgi:hypothetical protein
MQKIQIFHENNILQNYFSKSVHGYLTTRCVNRVQLTGLEMVKDFSGHYCHTQKKRGVRWINHVSGHHRHNLKKQCVRGLNHGSGITAIT